MINKWLATVIFWDGVLPLLAALCPWLVNANIPKNDIAELVAVFLVPIVLSLIRATLARRTLATCFSDHPPLLRQTGLALAIMALLFVEISFGLQVFVPEAPILPFALIGWLVYLGLMSAATFPPARSRIRQNPISGQGDARERAASSALKSTSNAPAA